MNDKEWRAFGYGFVVGALVLITIFKFMLMGWI